MNDKKYDLNEIAMFTLFVVVGSLSLGYLGGYHLHSDALKIAENGFRECQSDAVYNVTQGKLDTAKLKKLMDNHVICLDDYLEYVACKPTQRFCVIDGALKVCPSGNTSYDGLSAAGAVWAAPRKGQ